MDSGGAKVKSYIIVCLITLSFLVAPLSQLFIRSTKEDAPWAVMLHVSAGQGGIGETDPTRINTLLDRIKELGASYVRTEFRWIEFEPAYNIWNNDTITFFNNYVEAIRDRGLEIIAILFGGSTSAAPGWALTMYEYVGSLAFMEVFENYTAKIAQLYGNKIRYYQIWNEANVPFFPGKGGCPIADEDDPLLYEYGRRGIAMYDTDFVTIANLGDGGPNDSSPWTNSTAKLIDYLNRGAGEYIDIWAFDMYPGSWYGLNTGENYADWRTLDRWFIVLSQYSETDGKAYKAAIMETGYSTFWEIGGYDEAAQRTFVNDALPQIESRARNPSINRGVPYVFTSWYEIVDLNITTFYTQEKHFGIVDLNITNKLAFPDLTEQIKPNTSPFTTATQRTIPGNHYVLLSGATTPYGVQANDGYSVDTINSPEYNYDFMGFSSSDLYVVPSNGIISVSGYFLKSDDFYGQGLEQGRSFETVYVLNDAGNSILASAQVLNYLDNNNEWFYRTATFSSLTPGASVRIGAGRTDGWEYDWHLVARWTHPAVTASHDAFDFALSVSPSSDEVRRGTYTTATVNVTHTSGHSEQVALSASNVPTGVIVTFAPGNGTPSFTSTMTVSASQSAPLGTHTLTISGTGGNVTHSVPYQLNVSDSMQVVESFAAKTIPTGHFISFSNISTPYGPGWDANTVGSSDWNYHFMGYTDKDRFQVKADGTLGIGGYFLKDDTFYQYGLQKGRSHLVIYVLSSDGSSIVQFKDALDYTFSNNVWYYRDVAFTGLTPGSLVRIGVGRDDGWMTDWKLRARWSNVSVDSAGMQRSMAKLTPSELSATHFHLSLTGSLAEVKQGSKASMDVTLTVTWTHNETRKPLVVDAVIPRTANSTAPWIKGTISPPTYLNETTTAYEITFVVATDAPALDYPILIRVRENAGKGDEAVKTTVFRISVKG